MLPLHSSFDRTVHRTLLLVLLLASAACEAPDSGPVRIGVALDQGGLNGASLALEEVNAAGGVHGRAIELLPLPERYGSSAESAIERAETLAADPSVLAVLGHSSSAASLAASQVYNARQLLHITPTATTPLLSEAGPYTFRMVPSDRQQAAFLAEEVRAAGDAARLAVIYVNNDYGRALHQELRTRLQQRGIRVVYEAPYRERDEPARLRAMAETVVSARADLLVWIGRPRELTVLLPAVRSSRADFPVLGSDALEEEETYANRDSTLTGVRFLRFIDPVAEGPTRAVRERYLARHGAELTAQALLSYDAVMLLAEGMRAGARDRNALRDYVASIGSGRPGYAGISGTIRFDRSGDGMRPYLVALVTRRGVLPASTRVEQE